MFLFKLVWRKILQTPLIFFLLVVIFENLTVKLYILIISSMFVKFQEDQRLIAMSSIKIFKFQVFVV